MAINASIISGLKPVQLESPVNSLAKLLELKNMQQSGDMNRLKMEEYQRGLTDENQMRDLTRQSGGDMNKLRELAYGAGNYKQGTEIDKTLAANKKAATDQQKAELEGHFQRFDAMDRIMSGVNDQASYDRALPELAAVLGPQAAAQMPPMFDPARIAANRAKAMSAKERQEAEYKALTFGETQANNLRVNDRALQGQQIQRDGQAQQRESSIRTDERAREFNATKVEDNRIKREAKDDTANLTKASQVASFDTMLGTLDRLGQHPGLARSVGAIGMLPTMPGSDSANFQAELDTFQSQAFLPMVAQLKGMGALSDAEGKKLTAAVGALNPKMGEAAFRDSVQRITDDMQAARSRMVGGGQKGVSGSFDAPKDGAVSKSKSGKPIVMRNGKWEYQ